MMLEEMKQRVYLSDFNFIMVDNYFNFPGIMKKYLEDQA